MTFQRPFVPLAVFLCISASACRPRATSASAKSGPVNWSQIQQDRSKAVMDYQKRRPVSWEWFNESPLGFNGTPLVVQRALIEYFPDVWKKDGTLNHLGFPPRPGDYKNNGKLRDPNDRLGLPFGFGWATDPYEKDPKKQTLNTFFTCGACHTGRVIVDGKVKLIPGGPSTEVEPQGFALLQKETAKKFVFAFSPAPLKSAPDAGAMMGFYSYLQKLRNDIYTNKLSPGFFFGGIIHEGKEYNGVKQDQAYYKKLALSELDKVLEPVFYKEVMANFSSTLIKADITYTRLASTINYRQKNGKEPPPLHFSKPGQMDPWGIVQGNIALNAIREDASWLGFIDQFYAGKPTHKFFFEGNSATDPKQRYGIAAAKIVRNAGGMLTRKEQSEEENQKDIAHAAQWYATVPANIDVRPIWMSKDQYWANWDGNQLEAARTLASGVSAVGDPRKVDVGMHSAMNHFIADLPATPYPFAVDGDAASRGEAIFNANCMSCHSPSNKELYDVGTDRNRLLPVGPFAREALISLTQEACVRDMRETAGKTRRVDDFDIAPDWCASKDPTGNQRDLYAQIDPVAGTRDDGIKLGYKAGPLHGVWASAPYLHNGSVPTLRHLLQKTADRPQKFVRGNINYDQKNLGFVWDKEPTAADYPDGETRHFTTYDTSLNGNSNSGHEHGSDLPDSDKSDLIEYLKTL